MFWTRTWQRIRRNRTALLSLSFLAAISLAALLAPVIAPYSFDTQIIEDRLQPPSIAHWMGTDTLGRDLYSRILYGARMSLAVGVITALFALILGTVTGALAGYFGGWLDQLLMRIVDIFYVFPSLLMAILLMLVVGRGFMGIFLAIGLATWVTQARLVRALVAQAKGFPYVEAARSVGVPHLWIIVRHILPNLLGPVIVSLTFQIPNNIMAESFLSFIGVGLQPPFSSWGTLANEGFRAMRSYPYLIVFPGGILFITMMAFNYLGDALRDILDPTSDAGKSF
ncbi:MAG: ABC transporter permease [Bacteriovoracia bacterium]